ncbi:cuticle protein 14-like isoform X2 [Varroa destructor]|uniref:Adult-specific rigid cuticular protein 15.7 n=1 Tax=Varroa destructor TaxID=109461 RepID=A0A7M7K4V3_VARDE|nr:cuticle protein 14-like isoform X2 [Varroa destructor]
MKAFVACATILLLCLGSVKAGGGQSNSLRKQDDYGNYAFSYDIADKHGAVNGRKEYGGPHGVSGSYYIGDIDGRHRTVHYVADKIGFRAQIKTNEPGTKTTYAASAAYASANGNTALAGGYYADLISYKHGSTGYNHGGYGHAVSYGTYGAAGPVFDGHGGFGHGMVGYEHSIAHGHHGGSIRIHGGSGPFYR